MPASAGACKLRLARRCIDCKCCRVLLRGLQNMPRRTRLQREQSSWVAGLHLQVLCQIKGLSEAKIEKMLEAAHKMVPTMGWQSARAYDQLVSSPASAHDRKTHLDWRSS